MKGVIWLRQAGDKQYLSNNQELGLFFQSPQAEEVTREFKSSLYPKGGAAEIRPPISEDKLEKYGAALVDRARTDNPYIEVSIQLASIVGKT